MINSVDAKLRLKVTGHRQQQMSKEKWCGLCGMNTGETDYRGHRSMFKCTTCGLHLCVRTYSGMRRSCWDIWHLTKRLEPRKARRSPSRSTASDDLSRNRLKRRTRNSVEMDSTAGDVSGSTERGNTSRRRRRRCNESQDNQRRVRQ